MGMTWSEYKAYREKKKKEEEQTKKQQKTSSNKAEKTITNNANNQEKNNNLINTISQNNRLPLNNENANKIASNTPSLQDIVSKNNSSKIVQSNNNPLAKQIEEQNANKPLQKAIEEQKKKPKTTQKEPSTWERIMDNFRIGGYGGITGVAQTGYRDIRDIDNMYTDASSLMRHQVLSTFFGEHGENFARAVDDKLSKWNNDRNQVYNYALDVLNKEQQTNKQNIQQNIEAVKQSGDKVGTKFAELAPSVGNNAMGLLAGTVNPALAFTYYKGSSEASYYDDALQRGMTEDQAKVYSKLMSYVEAGTETISAGNILKGGKAIKAVASGAKNIGVKEGLKAGFNVFKESAKEETANALKQGLKSYGIGIAEEFFQEAITEPIQEFTAMKVAGEDKADWNNMWQRMLQSGVDGALSSAILAGANMGISSCQGIVTKVQNGQEFTTEEYNTAIKDASEKVDVGKMTTDGIKNQVEKLKTEMQQSQNGVNKDINQENKMPQNQFSQAEKTETLRQEARNKLESIKQNYDEISYNQMQEFIETAPSEKALNQVINDLNKEAETKQVAPLKQETQSKSFEDVVFDAMNNYESNEVESPLKNRDMDSIGKQTKVNAYQYDNPKVKPYFQEMAQQMGEDLAYIASPENRSTKKGGGTKLSTSTKAMDILHNEQGYSYDQIAKGLQNIIDDKGSENNAISKKIELVIDEQLRNGYNNAFGKYVEPNQEYINTIQGNKDVQLPMKQEKPNIINKKVNEYIDSVKDNFKSDINIKTQSINEGDVAPLDYNKAGQSVLAKKAQNLVDRLKTRVFKNNNEDIHVSNTDIKKSISETLRNKEQSKYKKENIAVFSQLDKVIENGKEISSDIKDNKNRDYYSGYKYYVSNVNIDGTPYVVEFDTRLQDSGDGSMERHFRLERVYPVNKNEVVSNTAPKETSDNTFLNETTSINNSISQNEQNVKSDNTNINNMQNNQENMQQFSMSEQQKQNNFEYKESKNSKVDTFRKDASKYWDNSEKTNKLVNTIEKVINDKGYNIRLDDTLGDNVNGRIVTNNQTGEIEITLNPNSSRTGEFILGHELTHAIQTQEMIDLVNDRITKDGDLRNAVEDLKKLYGTDEINAEVLADISGQLFGNQEFINNLSVEKPSVFKRIYDKIISLANKITGNSSEALFIKDLKSKWEKAYRENTNAINEAQYSKTSDLEVKQQQNKIIQENNPLDKTLGEHTWINSADDIKTYQEAIDDFGGINNITPDFTAEDVRKALDTGKITIYSSYPIEQGTFVTPSKMEAQSYAGRSQVYSKEVNLSDIAWIDEVQGQYAKVEAQNNNSNITTDNQGRKLSEQQQEFFKDSKVRDENGNLLTVYHGSNSEFNIFDLSKGGQSNSGASIGFWFTESKEGAENFANEVWYGDKKPNAKEVYLDMKNPKVYENIENDEQKQMYKEKSEKLEKEAKDLRKEYSWDKTDYKTTMTFDTLLRDYQTEKYTKQPVNIELFEGLAKERGFNDEQISKMEKDAKEYVRLMEESKKAENEYYKFLYSDAYEQYKIDLYEVAGQTAEDANVGGLGMALNNPKETVEKFRNKLISEGYDGIIIKNTQYDKSSFNGANNQYVIFNSNQAKNVNNTNPTSNPDIRYSKQNQSWQDYLEKNYKSEGTTTDLRDIRLPMKQKQEVKVPIKQKVLKGNDGKTLKVYHGSPNANITEFDSNKAGSNTQSDFEGIYFTDNPSIAEDFSYEQLSGNSNLSYKRGNKGKVYENNLKYNNALNLNNLTEADIQNLEKYIDNDKLDGISKEQAVELMKKMAQNNNAQGVKFYLDFNALKNDYDLIIADMGGKYKGSNEYIVFNNNQIISNDNTATNKQEVKAPMKENVQQSQNNNTQGETINWAEIERPENNQKFRKHYRSIIESNQTTAEAKAIAKELMGTDTYVPETNKGQLAQADQRIMTSSPEVELQSLLSRAMNGEKISSVDIAVGERLIQYFSKTGSKQQLQEAIQATAMAGTSAGQTVQALAMLNHQTPQGQATWIQRSVDKMNKELAKKKGGTITTDSDGNVQVINKQGKDITNKVDLFNLTPEMIDKIMNSENQEQMYKNIDEVYEELGQQVPKSMIEKIDTWRYFSMLANARTHIRNMVGNVAMGSMQFAKNKLAGGIEDIVSKFNPNMERTKTLKFADKNMVEFAKQDVKNADVQSMMELNENKYNPQSRLQNARKTFKHDALENTLGKMFNINDTALEWEDGIGLKANYIMAMSNYLKANKLDVNNITDAQLSKARNYAIQQAKEATFHQANALANLVNQLGTKNKVGKFIVDATLPFKKTPMNVAKSGIEYSPVGLLKSAIFDTANLRKGNISINQYIDNVSKGLTGSGVALVGYALAKAGIIKASGSDDKDKEKYDEEQGKQSYSIQIAGKTYSLDWLAPTGIPLFIGAEINNLENQQGNEKNSEKKTTEDWKDIVGKSIANITNAGATAINPMSEMSMISGITSVLSSYNKDNALGDMATNMGKSYINQFVPTVLGQVAKTTDDYERTTKSTATGTIGKAVDQTINQIKNKIPGLRQTLPIKTDIWGKELKQEVNLPLRAVNNFINPATVKEVSTDKVDMELNKLYEENRNSALLPDILTKTVQLNKQTYRLSNKEYAEFTKNYGQTSHKLIENFIKTSDYNRLTQEQKETAISNIYSYAKEQNKLDYAKKVNEEVKPSTLYTTMEDLKKNGGKQSEYLNYLAKTKGMSKESEKNRVLANSNYSNKTKEIIYTNGTGKDDNLYNDLLSKSNLNITEYLDYKNKVSNKAFSADKDKNGKAITGTAKKKTINYLNNNITGYGNRLLIAGKSYVLQKSEKQKLAEYINSSVSTREERLEIYKQLDKNFTIKNGKVYMKVSKK